MNRPFAVALLTFAVAIPAVSLLCHSTPSVAQKPAPAPATAYSPAMVKAGEAIFLQRCFMCHSVVEGEVRFGPSLHGVMKGPHPRKTPAQAREILHDGKNKMPSFKDILTPDDTDKIIAYLHSL